MGLRTPKGGARKGGARKGGAPKGGARKGGAPKGGGPKIPRFFFPLPPPFRSFCVSLGVFSWNFGGARKLNFKLRGQSSEFSFRLETKL